MTEGGLDRWGLVITYLEQWADEVLVIWPHSPKSEAASEGGLLMAWPRPKADDGSWQEINFPSQRGWKLKLAACDWPVYGASVHSPWPRPVAHCTLPLRGTLWLTPLGLPRLYCRRREHSASLATHPSPCGCQRLQAPSPTS